LSNFDAMRQMRGELPEESSTTGFPRRIPEEVLLTNIETVPGKTIVEHFGMVNGSLVRSKHFGSDFLAGMKNIVGGELTGYTKLLEETREEAIRRMVAQAKQMGANAVVNVRFSTSSVAQGAAELYVYGTAVRVE
jgi:uncharacterized protein YbjQ (UPF0145 family)